MGRRRQDREEMGERKGEGGGGREGRRRRG